MPTDTAGAAKLVPGGGARAGVPVADLMFLAALGVAIGYVASLAVMFIRHEWLLDSSGRPIPMDFLAIWSAGRLASAGAAVSAYDGVRQHLAEVAAAGHEFRGFLGWPYPPDFFFVAQPLANLPYTLAFVVGVAASFTLHGLSLAAITRRAASAAFACAAPWALACAMVGQNGFLTAALVGFVLLTLDESPALSGLLLGLLAYKPHLGLLFPLALAASGRWRAFGWAAASTVGLIGLSVLAYGPGAFIAFLNGLPSTTQALVSHGGVGWAKLDSLYGLTRVLGASNVTGWAVQGVASFACALSVVVVWRGSAPFALKAACLAAATVLATPYVFAYDLPVLSVAAGYLYRQRAFDRVELGALVFAGLTFAPLAFVTIPTGLFASLAISALVCRRVLAINIKETVFNAPQRIVSA
jgi:hypothetical protein